MRSRSSIAIFTGLVIVLGAVGQSGSAPQRIEEVLPKIRSNVMNNTLALNWNIACNHRETMTYSNKGVLEKPSYVVESVIVGRGRSTPLAPGEYLWSRELVSFEGNP